MDKVKTTPKDFFLWAGAMVALYVSVFSFINLIFDYINYAFPDPLAYLSPDPYTSGISYEMASLIILFPVFLILMRLIHRDIERDSSRREIWVRKWALMLTLFLAGATIVIDLITLLNAFLSGEDLTAPFLLKVLIVLLVAGAGFLHFISDLWGYWEKYPTRARTMGWASGALIILTILAGFFIIGTPQQARLRLFDTQKISDLQTIEQQVVTYWQQKQAPPITLTDLSDSISGFSVPVDAQTGAQYGYTVLGPTSFELCATFNATGDANATMINGPVTPTPLGGSSATPDTWQHAAGHVCFDRTIDPQHYPPIK